MSCIFFIYCCTEGGFGAVRKASEHKLVLMYLLVLGSPGLIIVDHIHFQYNGMLLGKWFLPSPFMYRRVCVVAVPPLNVAE